MRISALSPWIEGNESITPYNFFARGTLLGDGNIFIIG